MSQEFSWPVLNEDPAVALERSVEQARQNGYAQGLSEGQEAAAQEVQALKGTLNQSITALAQARDALALEDSQSLLELVRSLTSALIAVELKTNSHVIERFIEEAVSRLGTQREGISLQIAAADAQWLPDLAGVRLEIEPAREPGVVTLCNREMEVEFAPYARLSELLENADGHTGTERGVARPH